MTFCVGHVCYWHKADIGTGHRTDSFATSAYDPTETLAAASALDAVSSPFQSKRLSRVGPLGKTGKADGLASGLLFCAEEISAEVVAPFI
jgi:hypothetical protein